MSRRGRQRWGGHGGAGQDLEHDHRQVYQYHDGLRTGGFLCDVVGLLGDDHLRRQLLGDGGEL